jgi:acetyl esterase/lipase
MVTLSAAAAGAQPQPPASAQQAATGLWPDPAWRLEVVRLWPEGVPGAIAGAGPEIYTNERVSNVHDPTLTVFPAPPEKNTGSAVIVCPGGGYTIQAIEKEGRAVAEWLNAIGVNAFVLRYRLKEYGHPAPLRDVLRAVRMLRAEPARWRISPDRIGVLGFSAGGHLAASAATMFDDPDGKTGASLDATSARPDFAVLVYPVIRLVGPEAHSGSWKSLLGEPATPEMRERMSPDTRVTKQTPPTFLVHGGTDTAVPPENSVAFYLALRRTGVPAELHLFQDGAHGFGLLPGNGPISDWPKRCAEWFARRSVLTAPAPRQADKLNH